MPVGSRGVSKHGYKYKSLDRILVIGIPDLLMDLIYCHGSLRKINYAVILKFP